MKKTILLLLWLGLGSVQAETRFLPSVSKSWGWSDFNKELEDENDDNLCWAAAASNVIPDDVPTGDDIWTTLKSSVNANIGGYPIRPCSGGSRNYIGHEMPDTPPLTNGTLNGMESFTGFCR